MAYRFTTAQRANRALYTLQVEKRIQRGLHWQTTTVSIVCTSLRRAYEMRRPGEVARIYRVEHDANGQERGQAQVWSNVGYSNPDQAPPPEGL